MNKNDIIDLLSFIKEAEKLKNTYRASHTSNGRVESVAEHTWRLCLMVLILEDEFPEIDMSHVLKICVIHDLGEAIIGDIPAPDQKDSDLKSEIEKKGLLQIVSDLPRKTQNKILAFWLEYENQTSEEAKLAKALDKIETLAQLNQGVNTDNFNYKFNLKYGEKYTSLNHITSSMRKILDIETIDKIKQQNKMKSR